MPLDAQVQEALYTRARSDSLAIRVATRARNSMFAAFMADIAPTWLLGWTAILC